MTPAAPITLIGNDVRLEALSPAHADGLIAASRDGDLAQLHYTSVPEPDDASVRSYIRSALEGQYAGAMLPFAVLDDGDGSVLGSTRFYDIDASVPTCAIGYTWYAARVQRTHVNTACKRLLLGHAFEHLACRRSTCTPATRTCARVRRSNVWVPGSTA